MTIRRWLSSALIVALVSALVPASGWAGEATPANTARSVRLDIAIRKAAAGAVNTPALQLRGQAPAQNSGTRRQAVGGGGGHAGMIIGLVTTVVGVGATVYMVKQLQKTTKNVGY